MVALSCDFSVVRGEFRLNLALQVASGEVVALLGPNGAGKSTALRALAGLLPINHGRVVVGGRVLADSQGGVHVPAHQRPMAVVFQDYLLFPHLSVRENVAFGPRARGVGAGEARAIADRWLARVGVSQLSAARPRAISGGQAQRVALARALATQPEVLLLDEPLAALDARTRLLVRSELRRHLRTFAGATLLVTHDAIDAAVLADRLVVVESGSVVQTGSPAEVVRRPRTDYVARLVGLNLFAGHADGYQVTLPSGGKVHVARVASGPVQLAFRPAAVSLFTSRPDGSPRNVWWGQVAGLEPHGEGVRVEVLGAPDDHTAISAEITQVAVADLGLVPGQDVWVTLKASEIESYPISGELDLDPGGG